MGMKKMGMIAKLAVSFVAVGLISAFISESSYDPAVEKARAANDAINVKVLPYVSGLKRQMRDPESFVLTFAGRNDDGSKVCIEYRAKNGFGGYTNGMAVGAGDKIHTTQQAWNAHCANKTLVDLTTYAKWNG